MMIHFVQKRTSECYLEGLWVFKAPFREYGLGYLVSEQRGPTLQRHF